MVILLSVAKSFFFFLFLFLCCREACEAALKQKHYLENSEIDGYYDEVSISNSKQLKDLDKVFQIVAEADTPKEVRVKLLLSFIK